VKIGVLLSVRSKATRLPGKVLKPFYDGNVTEFLLRRLQSSFRADLVVLATSIDPRDDELAQLAEREGVVCFRGSPEDKLFRYRDAARLHALDFVVVVDGDDPFVSVRHLDRVIEYAAERPGSVDLVTFDNLPLGAAAWGIAVEALEKVCRDRMEANTEVWGSMFRSDPRFRVIDLHEDDPRLARPAIRMTLDYESDYRFLTTIADALKEAGQYPSFETVMDHVWAHPELTELNRDAQAAYEAHLEMSAAK
jgi:spore coat polysaccharide biosynthesis protein SpsF